MIKLKTTLIALTICLTVQAQWPTPLTLDINGNVGLHVSMNSINGYPAVAYYHNQDRELLFKMALDSLGSQWDTTKVAAEGGRYADLALVNGKPAIAYYSKTGNNLMYVRASDSLGKSWESPVTLDAPGNVGAYASLAIINGNPAVAYHQSTAFDLKYVRANDIDGDTWNTPVTVVSAGSTGQYSSLTEVNGKPAISYYNRGGADFEYVLATDSTGDSWGTPVVVDANIPSSFHSATSIQIINGKPAIAYHDDDNQDLKYVRAIDIDGTTWGSPLRLDSIGNTGDEPCMTAIAGHPAISYSKAGGNDVYYIRAADSSGSSWGNPELVYSTAKVGDYNSLLEVNGEAAIAYYRAGGGLFYIAESGFPNMQNKHAASLTTMQKGLTLYPNPATTEVNVRLKRNYGETTFYILDTFGKLVSEGSLNKTGYSAMIDVSELVPGVYIMIAKFDTQRFTEKLVIR